MQKNSFRFNVIISVMLLGAILFSCSKEKTENKRRPNKTKLQSKAESFDEFYKFFFSDSLNQVSRIKFPLKVIQFNMTEHEYEKYDTIYSPSNEWTFVKTESEVVKSKITSRSKKRVVLVYYGIDPPNWTEGELALGLYVEYIFELENGKWYLTQIIDSST